MIKDGVNSALGLSYLHYPTAATNVFTCFFVLKMTNIWKILVILGYCVSDEFQISVG
ncbi:hypothetical protein [Runella aurantiaca]|uniref:hypothetical protein n=1 Tax=Runella aurantiaca TaxID=2282308 RepID=UPI001314D679|nr:hypothetical protein [Runella aurantiaca]